MIRKFEPRDIEPVMQIWLRGNLQAHSFVSAAYWKQNVPLVREQLLQAEGFGDVVVGPKVKAEHRVDLIVAGSQKDGRLFGVAPSCLAQQGQI